MSDKKYRVYRREWLNEPGVRSSAFILAYVKDTSEDEHTEDSRPWPSMGVSIADCSRKVTLEFSIADRPDHDLDKLDTLIEVLSEVREAMAEERKLYIERMKEREEKGWKMYPEELEAMTL